MAPRKPRATRQRRAEAVKLETKANPVRSLTYCVRERKKTGNIDAKVHKYLLKGKPRYRLSSICTECGSHKNTFLSAGSDPIRTVHGGRIK